MMTELGIVKKDLFNRSERQASGLWWFGRLSNSIRATIEDRPSALNG